MKIEQGKGRGILLILRRNPIEIKCTVHSFLFALSFYFLFLFWFFQQIKRLNFPYSHRFHAATHGTQNEQQVMMISLKMKTAEKKKKRTIQGTNACV